MCWEELLRPNLKKISLFILLFFLIPYPLWFFYFPLDVEFSLTRHYEYIFPPFIFSEATGEVIRVIREGWSPYCPPTSEFIVMVILPLIYPFFLYLVTCWIISAREKKKSI